MKNLETLFRENRIMISNELTRTPQNSTLGQLYQEGVAFYLTLGILGASAAMIYLMPK